MRVYLFIFGLAVQKTVKFFHNTYGKISYSHHQLGTHLQMYQCIRSFPKYFGNRGLVLLISFEPALFALGDTQATNKDQNVSENQSEADDTTTRIGKEEEKRRGKKKLQSNYFYTTMYALVPVELERTSIDTPSSLQLS